MSNNNSLWTRITRIFKAKSHKALNSIEDIESMAEQSIREQETKVLKAKDAIATAVGNHRLAQKKFADDQEKYAKIGSQIESVMRESDLAKERGEDDLSAKYDQFLDGLITQQMALEQSLNADARTIADNEVAINELKNDFTTMEQDLQTLRQQKDSLISRARSTEARQSIMDVREQIDMSSGSSEIGRLSAKVERDEARLIGRREVAEAGNIELQISKMTRKSEIEARKAFIRANPGALTKAPATPEAITSK